MNDERETPERSRTPEKPTSEAIRCFRHQFEPLNGHCALCEAKQLARGDLDSARKIFVLKKK